VIVEIKGRNIEIDPEHLYLLNGHNWHWINSNVKGKKEKWYLNRSIGGKTRYLHRLIIEAKDGEIADHRNGDTLNCRKGNLRIVTASQNRSNSISNRENMKGVYKRKNGTYYSMLSVPSKKSIYIGSFKTNIEASIAYQEKRTNLGL